MHIQWYPGHMHKAAKELRQNLSQIDWFVEVIDARVPYSSENPMIEEIRQDKPVLKVLTKTDIADPALTERWEQHWKSTRGIDAIRVTIGSQDQRAQIMQYGRETFRDKISKKALVQGVVVGAPNVGKSTLINALLGRKVAKTGNEAAVTKHQQRIDLGEGLILTDTPGMLWPKIENRYSGYRLGFTGSIKDTVLDYEFLAEELLVYLLQAYPDNLSERYQLDIADLPDPDVDLYPLLLQIAKKRGTLLSGNRPDMGRLSKIIIHEFRSGELGNITLETPEMITQELAIVAREAELKAAQKAARKAKRK